MAMIRYYRFLYYNLYRLWQIKKDERENAPINAIISISALTWFNGITILLIMQDFFGITVFNMSEMPPYWLLIFIFICYGIFQYFLLAAHGKHKKIVEEFKNIKPKKRIWGRYITVIYVIISILVCLIF